MKTNLLKNIGLGMVALIAVAACQKAEDLNFAQSEFQKRAEANMISIAKTLSLAKTGTVSGGNRSLEGWQPQWPSFPSYTQNQSLTQSLVCKQQALATNVVDVASFKSMLATLYQCITFSQNQFQATNAFVYNQGTPATQYAYGYAGFFPAQGYTVAQFFNTAQNQMTQQPVQNYFNYMGSGGMSFFR